jgi:hypothetical protein
MTSIYQDQLFYTKVQAAIKETGGTQPRRLAEYLLINHCALTGEIARDCSIGNISDAASKIRPALERRGITITARLPKQLSRNRFGEVSQAHEWRLQVLR